MSAKSEMTYQMVLRTTPLYRVHAEFDDRLGHLGKLVVAGGAVRDHLMGRQAKDFDLFLLNTPFTKEAREAVTDALDDLEVVKPLAWHNSEPYLVMTVRWQGFDVQVMCNPAVSIDALVDTFDWNVARFAFDGENFTKGMDVDDIGYGKELKLHRVTFPTSTLRRGFRFAERFAMSIDPDIILLLCEEVVKKRNNPGPRGAEPDMPALAANYLIDR